MTSPATSRNASALPAIRPDVQRHFHCRLAPAGTDTDPELNDTECAEPAALAWATPNVIAELPWFRIGIRFVFE